MGFEKKIPSIKPYIQIYENESDLIFHSYQTAVSKFYDKDMPLKRLFKVVDGEKNVEEIIVEIKSEFSYIEDQEIMNVIKYFIKEGILHFENKNPEVYKYKKRLENQLAFFEEYSTSEEPMNDLGKLKKSKVVIIGIGGAGTWIAQSLAMANVGKLVIVDEDIVEESNLNRQVLFRINDIGKPKVKVAKLFLNQLNPDIEIEAIYEKATSNNIEDIIQNADLVISCADSPSTTEMGLFITSACTPRKVPHIIGGGYNSHIGMLGSTVIPGKTGCFQCYMNTIDEKEKDKEDWRIIHEARRTPKIGSIAAVSGFVGNIISLDAIKVLTGFAEPWLTNKFVDFHFGLNKILEREYSRSSTCSICGGVNNE